MFNRIGQLPHITWPMMAQQIVQSIRRKTCLWSQTFPCLRGGEKPLEEKRGKFWDVTGAGAQGRELDFERIDAE